MDTLKDFPLAEYAAEHWVGHARFENVSSTVQDGMKRLFDPSKSHLSVWDWIYDSDPENPRLRSDRYKHPAEARATPLHYAAVYDMHDIATFLFVEHPQDVSAGGFVREETPLHVSSRRGHVEVARVLLKHGADTEARDNGITAHWSGLPKKGMWNLLRSFWSMAQIRMHGTREGVRRCIWHRVGGSQQLPSYFSVMAQM